MRYNSPASFRYLLRCWRCRFLYSELCGEYILEDTETATSVLSVPSVCFVPASPFLILILCPGSCVPSSMSTSALTFSLSSSFQSKSCYPGSCLVSVKLPKSKFLLRSPLTRPVSHHEKSLSPCLQLFSFCSISVCLLPLSLCLHRRFPSFLVLSVTVFFFSLSLNFHLFPISSHSFS